MVNIDAQFMSLQSNHPFPKQLYPDAYGAYVQIIAKTALKARIFVLPAGNVPLGPSLLNQNNFINALWHASNQ